MLYCCINYCVRSSSKSSTITLIVGSTSENIQFYDSFPSCNPMKIVFSLSNQLSFTLYPYVTLCVVSLRLAVIGASGRGNLHFH